MKETDKRLNELREEAEKRNAELDKKMGKFTNILGEFVEGLVKPRIVELFVERNIPVYTVYTNIKGLRPDKSEEYQIDMLLLNNTIAVAVEIKTKLTVEDVRDHLERLDKIRINPPHKFDFSGMTVLGAVAGINIEGDADKFAYRKGLFVLKQRGEIVEIANDEQFVPTEWKIETKV